MKTRHATFAAALWLLAAGALAETLTQSTQLSRAQLEAPGATFTLTAADAAVTTRRTLFIELRFADALAAPVGGNAWTYTVNYRIVDTFTTTQPRSLTIFRGLDRDVFRAVDSMTLLSGSARVIVDGVTTTDPAAVPQAVALDARVESVRFAAFNRNAAPTLSSTTGAAPMLQWTAVASAEEYEVESVFVDAREQISGSNPFAAKLPIRFQTRQLSTPVDTYRPAGTVHYRVRAVGRHVFDREARRYGSWSATLSVPLAASGFEAGKNWQYERRYDGAGPTQGKMNYFDNSLRLRQAQTAAPDQAARRIAETKYDFEGRGAVNFLAAPEPGTQMQFVPGFNRSADGSPYGPQHFDRSSVSAASTASGAGRYFSAANTANDPHSPYLPDAGGFPFSVAQHTRDDSARLRAMSGFGAQQRLGGGHDTVYVYGDAAEPQLRPLFGPNLGDVGYFERTVVGDANRSFEVTYRDRADRVVAQSLVGDPPANLSDLPNAPSPALVTVSMDANNHVDAAAGRSTLNYRIANAVNTSYFFAYSPTGVDYTANPLDSRFPPLCESCRYRLKIRVLGPDGAPVPLARESTPQNDQNCAGLTTTSQVNQIEQLIENPNPPACPANAPDSTRGYTVPPIRFCAQLTEPGEYEVRKTLEFVDGDIDATVAQYKSKPGFFNLDTYRDPVDPASCGETCTAHCAAATGVDPATSPNDPQLRQCIDRCENPQGWVLDRIDQNKCDSLEQTLLSDMAPGGRHHRANGSNTLNDHPEACHVGVCRALQTSNRYDAEMGLVDSYDEALCAGYLNPTGMPVAAGSGPLAVPGTCTVAQVRDPFFASGGQGAALRGTLDGQLASFTATIPDWADPTSLSLWQFVADPRINSVGAGAGPTPDEQWRLFRSLYLGAKLRLVIQHTESASGFNCPYSTATNARVPKPPLPSTVVAVIDAINGVTQQQCASICAQRVDDWMARLASSCPNPLDPARVEQSLALYCASSCGANNPLASLIEDDITAGDPNLAAALAALGPTCSLDDIAVEDPYVYQTVCGETCCTDGGPSECAKKLVATLAERSPATTGSTSVRDTPMGESLRTCMDWIDHVRFKPRTEFLSKVENQSCAVVLVAPDGTEINLFDARIVGTPVARAQPPPNAQGVSGLPYTGLVVDVEWRGARVSAAIYSDCQIEWTGKLDTPTCTTSIVSTPPPAACDPQPGKLSTALRSHVPRPQSCPIKGEGRRPASDEFTRRPAASMLSGPARSPPPQPPRDSCPTCLDELEALLEMRKPNELSQLDNKGGRCFVSLFPEGDRIQVVQPGGRKCSMWLLDPRGVPVPMGSIALFEEVIRNVPLPPGLTVGPSASRYMGAAVRVRIAGGTAVLYIFTDCDILSAEVCGTGCTPVTTPPACLSSVLARLLATHSNPPRSRDDKSASRDCFYDLRVDKNVVRFVAGGGRKCVVTLYDANGAQRPWAEFHSGALQWVGTLPARPTFGSMQFTGYIVVTKQGELAVYSDCAPPPETCVTIIVDVETPIPPPVGDPEDVCKEAVEEAADDRARYAVEQAQAELETHFKSVHYNRCFSSTLQETFSYQARSREYHFTLRYHDQAGNLVQTVPPAGVAPSTSGAPAHRMLSKFRFNSLNQVIAQSTPDTGERIFIYDRAEQVRFSQDAQQRVDGAFAYAKYDAVGRSVETGLLRGVGEAVIRARVNEMAFPTAADGTLEQVVRTIHDTAASWPACAPINPRNLRSRVAAIVAATSLGAATLCYSYDIEGRTESVLRDLPRLGSKIIDYEYDALTGRVSAVGYQPGQPDALHRRLQFDRFSQLQTVESSRDGVVWDRDARYSYFPHGPLARLELGGDGVQGLDHTYTIDGRPKGLNTGTLAEARDPGRDAAAGSSNAAVARDVVGQTLEFYAGDYTPIGLGAGTLAAASNPHSSAVAGTTASAFALSSCAAITVQDGCGLYEGNLARSIVGLEGLDGFARVTGFAYRYDRTYRLTEASSHGGLDPTTNLWPTPADLSLWHSSFGYDSNGNLRAVSRDALSSTTPQPVSAAMDDLSYRYASDTQGRLVANRLEHVNDTVADSAFDEDLDDQGAYAPANAGTHNYAYDANGNLMRDRAAGITAIGWNVDNRVSTVEVGADTYEYLYDGLGHRFAKVRKPSSDPATWEVEHFVRDENGNLVATYRTAPGAAPTPALEDLYLHGAGSIGVLRADRAPPSAIAAGTLAQIRGDKQYQLSNHLGHVLATVSDRRSPVVDANGTIAGFAAQILSTTDYDPFGAPAPGRFQETQPYAFGFSGFERDDELKGEGNSYYTQERLFDPRLGRWLSPDPVQLAHSSPYAGFSNNPTRYGDPRGALDWDSFKDTMENVAITARDIGRDTAYVFSGAAAVDAIADNLVKAKDSYQKGQTSEAIAHAIGIQGAIESLAQKDLDWQDAGATVEDRIRMGIGEVSGMNDLARAVTGETEFAQELSTAERWQMGIQGGVQVFTVAATGASLATSLAPKAPPGATAAPKPALKTPEYGPPCKIARSFVAGTPISMLDGMRRIEDVAVGDHLLSTHPESGRTLAFAVTAIGRNVHPDGLLILVAAPDGATEMLLTTSEHPFWRVAHGWTPAGELQAGDELYAKVGTLLILAVAVVEGEFEAFNLTVEDAATYFVGDLGAWVHNCLGGPHGKVKAKGFESHHTPANSISPLPTNKGPAIKMNPADHRKTASWGRSKEAQKYRAKQKQLIKQGKFKEAMEMDVRDIRKKFGKKYDKHIKEMRKYLKTIPKKDLK